MILPRLAAKINVAEGAIAARFRDPSRTSLDEEAALRDACGACARYSRSARKNPARRRTSRKGGSEPCGRGSMVVISCGYYTRFAAGNWLVNGVTRFGASAEKPEIRGRFGEFYPYFSAACVTPTNVGYATISFRPILGILDDKPLADCHRSR